MIVVDTSAVLAILLEEPEKRAFQEALARQSRCVMSAVNAHKAATVLRMRQGKGSVDRLWTLLADSGVEIAAFDEMQVRAAAGSFEIYGKGIHPRARLNLCDCAAYALAKTLGAALLFKGDDFPHTDVVPAV